MVRDADCLVEQVPCFVSAVVLRLCTFPSAILLDCRFTIEHYGDAFFLTELATGGGQNSFP